MVMGRPEGSKNKVTQDGRLCVMSVYNALGGAEGMLKWASKNNDNQTEFYRLFIKILPKDINIRDTSIVVHIGLNEKDKPIANGHDQPQLTSEAITSVHQPCH